MGNSTLGLPETSSKGWKNMRRDRLAELLEVVAFHLDLNARSIISASRKKEISEARALICHFAINDLSYSASEVARFLAISRVNPSVAKAGGLQSQGAEGEVVVFYFKPSATRDLKFSGFPAMG